MAITPKTAAAGVVGIGGTAAAGYGVSTLVKGEEWTISKELEKIGHEVLDVTKQEGWNKVAEAKLKPNGTETPTDDQKSAKMREFKEVCRDLLEKPYEGEKSNTDLTNAIEKCTTIRELKDISGIGGQVILTADYKNTIKEKWISTDNSTAKTALTDTSAINGLQAVTINSSTMADSELPKAISNCNKYSQKFNRFSKDFSTKLSNYQKLCSVSLSEINKKTKADTSNWKYMEDASFEVLDVSSSPKQDWLAIFEKNFSTKASLREEEKLNLIKVECVTLRNKTNTTAPTNSTEEYKESIKKCTKLVTLKDRAKSWGLVPLNTEVSEDSNPDKDAWTTKSTDTNKNSLDTTSPNKTWNTLRTKCKETESKTHFDSGFGDDLWTKYLKGCMNETKPESSVNPNHTTLITYKYWTKKTS